MGNETEDLKARIQELESDLAAKDAQLAQMRLRLSATNIRLERMIDQMGHEIKLASKVQRLLSPVELPNIQGFEFSTKFIPGQKSGGDYFDIFEHEDRMRFGIVLSSCSGYSLSALFLSVLMKISSKIEARRGLEPHEMINLMGREILPEMKREDQVSIFYAVVDRRTFELRYSAVGNVTAILQQQSETPVMLEPQAGPLHKQGAAELSTMKLSLNPRDRLILCSEGIAKTTNGEGQEWGTRALREAIMQSPRQGAHALRNEILYRCEAYAERHEPDRDQTVLAIEVKDKLIKLADSGS